MREGDKNEMVLESKRFRLPLLNLSPGLKIALKLLVSPAASESKLYDVAQRKDHDLMGGCRLMYYLLLLRRAGFLEYSLKSRTKVLATVEYLDDQSTPPKPIPVDQPLVFSRFAYLCKRNDEAVLESPLCQTRIVVKDAECLDAIFLLMRPLSFQQLFTRKRARLQKGIQSFVELLYALSFVCGVEEEGGSRFRYWEFHNLIIHARTRDWRRGPVGATLRFGRKSHPAPATDALMSSESIKLYRPNLESLVLNDRPFTEVLERRKSLRGDSGHVISADQVGEFLYRVARVRSPKSLAGKGEAPGPTDRPYPNAGACYELEVYLLVERCNGLSSGLYHYRPDSHELSRIRAGTAYLRQIIQDVKRAVAGTVPQVIVILTARFDRVFWKYEGIGYSLILKNVGVLFQTMYLVATAMQLMPCAVGNGDSIVFSRATGIDGFTEASVGEFILNG